MCVTYRWHTAPPLYSSRVVQHWHALLFNCCQLPVPVSGFDYAAMFASVMLSACLLDMGCFSSNACVGVSHFSGVRV